MRYELSRLDAFITTLHPSTAQKESNKGQIRDWLRFVHDQVITIRSSMIDEVLNTRNSKLNEGYVQAHQKGLINLLDTLLSYIVVATRNHCRLLVFLYKKICTELDGLLMLIIKLLNNFFDVTLPVPTSYAVLAHQELSEQWEVTRSALLDLEELDGTLLDIASKPLEDFLKDPRQRITYQRLSYLRDLTEQIASVLNKVSTEEDSSNFEYLSVMRDLSKVGLIEPAINVHLHMLLIYINHNSREYVNFCITALQQKVDAMPDINSKILLLRIYSKLMRLLRVKPHSRLEPEEHRVNRQVLDFIEGELEFVQMENNNGTATSATNEFYNGNNVTTAKKKIVNKLNTSFDVRELALLARLFKDSSKLKDHNTDIMRFIAQHYTTEGAEEPSYESIYNKWFNPRSSTALSVKYFLDECIKNIRKWL
ncbi:hypothetical protein [Chitinophaga defluvii]|uniref:Uncharacterized protein n=1 Tax=Chitinophaga defluvii TaxID=3163343 RepID=A0ABV2T9S3_9BACT